MVTYLKKPEGSEGFHQIVDFLNASHIRYALIENPTIYVSLIKQFWETATARTLDNGEIELIATIDGKVKIVIEASVLVVQGKGSTYPVESHHTPISAPSTLQLPISLTSRRINKQESVVPQPISPTQTLVADEAASKGVDVRYGGATTTVTSLEVEQGRGNIDKTPTMPHDSPLLRVNTLGSNEGNMTLQELMVLCTTLSKKGRKIAEIDQDPAILLVQHDAEIQGRHEHDMEFDFDLDAAKDVSTAEKDVSNAKPISTAGATVTTATVAAVRRVQPKTKVKVKWMNLSQYKPRQSYSKNKKDLVIKQLLDYKLNLRKKRDRGLPGYMKQLALLMSKNEKTYKLDLSIRRKRYFATQRAKERRNKPPTQAEQRTYMSNYIKHMGSHTLHQLRGYSFDEIKTLFETTMRRVNTFVLIESEVDRAVPELAAGSSKRDAKEELDQESSKRQKTAKSSELAEEPKDKEEEMSQEELQQIMIIVLEQRMNVKALQTKYPIIDWEIYTEGTRKYWKIIRVGNHTEVHQFFDDMLKSLDMDNLVMLWSLVKENFKSIELTNDKEIEIWVELKRLFEPDTYDLTWSLYDSFGVHHVSTEKGIDIYMLELKVYILSTAKATGSTAQVTTGSTNQLVLLEEVSTASTNLRLLKDLRLLHED
ncbi:hypothetical protein Tco_1145880 [Tanacetum coccineum]